MRSTREAVSTIVRAAAAAAPLSLLALVATAQSQILTAGPVVKDGAPGQKGRGGSVAGGAARSSECNYGVDDGTTETSVGLSDDGTLIWFNALEATSGCELISEIWIVWGSFDAPSSPPNGSAAHVYLWEDPNDDGNPSDAVLLMAHPVEVQNSGTGAEARYNIPITSVSGTFFLGASYEGPALTYSGAVDNTIPVVDPPVSWYTIAVFGPFDPENLAAYAPELLVDADIPGEWVMRAVGGSGGYVYQGLLEDADQPVDGTVDLSFSLYLGASGGSPLETKVLQGIAVEDGLFAAQVPFTPSLFTGEDRWLEISVANPAGSGFTTLNGRQRITAAPMASHAAAADTANSATIASTALSYSGTLPWNRLTSVPAGFADGIDDVGSGSGDGHSLDAADGSPTDAVFVDNTGRVAINLAAPPSPQGRLHVRGGSGDHPVVIERAGGPGTLVQFRVDGTNVGEITVGGGGTITYGSFTGVHLAQATEPLAHATLVRLSGNNARASDDPSSEIIYGVVPTTIANDPAVIGASIAHASGRDDVMSVGNGEMWVVQTSRAISPGDLLISSDVAGCAMLDDPSRFARGNIVARAAEPVDWSRIAPGPDGTRRALVSVLFDRFERGPDTGSLQQRIDSLDAENRALRARLDALEALLRDPARKEGAK